jgi:hypothetical protein
MNCWAVYHDGVTEIFWADAATLLSEYLVLTTDDEIVAIFAGGTWNRVLRLGPDGEPVAKKEAS